MFLLAEVLVSVMGCEECVEIRTCFLSKVEQHSRIDKMKGD